MIKTVLTTPYGDQKMGTGGLRKKTKVMKGLRLYVSGQNLFTFTKYTGFDPEVGFDGIEDPRRYIPGRTLIVGLNMEF